MASSTRSAINVGPRECKSETFGGLSESRTPDPLIKSLLSEHTTSTIRTHPASKQAESDEREPRLRLVVLHCLARSGTALAPTCFLHKHVHRPFC